MVVLLVFILATLEIALGGKKNCLTEENSCEKRPQRPRARRNGCFRRLYKIVRGASD